MNKNIVASFYKFSPWDSYSEYRDGLSDVCERENILGTILIAKEGINGTVSGEKESIKNLIDYISSIEQFKDLVPKFSLAYGRTFRKMRVRLKKEIVSMGVSDVIPHHITGNALSSAEWDKLLEEDDVVVVDTRNKYEHSIGSFEGATFPNTDSFREFPNWADKHLGKNKDKKIAMYCTGGIRCEKASSYLLNKGFKNVYQLDGGILKYLEDRVEKDSKWEGECFVFDYRVSLEHKLEKGSHDMCHACRMPISESDKESEYFTQDISCPHCYNNQNEKSIKRFKERRLQMNLQKERNKVEQRKIP
tara:strand:+ start:29 stop:943 length:915 start_codon:yes stop_codon:yes gene_type:complete